MPNIMGVSNLKDEDVYCLKSSPFRRIFFIRIPGASIFNELIFEWLGGEYTNSKG